MTVLRRYKFRFPTLLLVCSVLCLGSAFADQVRILYLSSYNSSFPTFYDQIQGVRDSFPPELVQIDVEFIDSKRLPQENYLVEYQNFLQNKLNMLPSYHALICGDDNAMNMGLKLLSGPLNGIPMVFFGVNNRPLALQMDERPDVTGVVEAVSMDETLSLIMELFPLTTSIVAVVDASTSGQSDLQTLLTYTQEYPIEVLSLEAVSFRQFTDQISALKESQVLLLLSAYFDALGASLSFSQAMELFRQNSRVPVFHLWYHGMGQGLFGGKLISQYEQARIASGMLSEHVFGEVPLSSRNVVTESPNLYVFDYEQLSRFGIGRHLLPAQSVIINEPVNFLKEHLPQAISIAAVIVFQFILILNLYQNIQYRQQLTQDLSASQARLRDLFQFSPIAFVEKDFSQVRNYLQSLPRLNAEKLEELLSSTPYHLLECQKRFKLADANKAALDLYAAKNLHDLQNHYYGEIQKHQSSLFIQELMALYSGKTRYSSVGQIRDRSNSLIWTNQKLVVPPSDNQTWNRVYVAYENITQTLEFQAQLKTNIEEKDMLLREIHHRVNNNLALITSFLNLEMQKQAQSNESSIQALQDSIQRIKAMAIVHRKLYRSSGNALETVDSYFSELIQDVVYAYNTEKKPIHIDIQNDLKNLDRELLMPLGLIINEVVSNSMKHAFGECEHPQITSYFRRDDAAQEIMLRICDNGSGLNQNRMAEAKLRHSLGMLIIQSLAEQIGARIEVHGTAGTCYTIYIPQERETP